MNWYKLASKIIGPINDIINDNIELLGQDTDYTCGNSVIQNLFRIKHMKIPSEADLAKAMSTTSTLGTAPEAIERFLHTVNMPFAKFKPSMSIETVLNKLNVILVEYQDYQETQPSEIVEVNQSSHYAILAGYDNSYYYIIDSYIPKTSNSQSKIKRIAKDKFLRDWKARSFDGREVVKQYGLIIPASRN